MPPTLGQRLRHAREQLKLSPEDVAFKIKIPAARLRDLEDDAYTAFGSLTYARSFLKNYASFLGIDASDVLQHIQSPPLGGSRDYRYLIEDFGPWVDEGRSHSAMMPPHRSTITPRSLMIAAAVSVLALVTTVSVLVANSSIFKPKPVVKEDTGTSSLVEKPKVKQEPAPPALPAPPVMVEHSGKVPPKALVVPDKNAPPPRAEIVQ